LIGIKAPGSPEELVIHCGAFNRLVSTNTPLGADVFANHQKQAAVSGMIGDGRLIVLKA